LSPSPYPASSAFAVELAERDRLVFEAAKRPGLPVAWNLAGDCQEPLAKVLEIHDNTMRACAAAYRRAVTRSA
jgi:hypothetical protein